MIRMLVRKEGNPSTAFAVMKNKNKDEHYWEPYRPYQQIASPDDNSEAAEKNPETFSSQDNISSENSIPSENAVLSENKKDTSSSE